MTVTSVETKAAPRLEVQLALFLDSSHLHVLLCSAYRRYDEARVGPLPDLERAQILDAVRGLVIMNGLHQSAPWDVEVDPKTASRISAWAWRLVERRFPGLVFAC
ncbi:hypothetical protein [Streptomyces sp. NPDC058268]|uniref:hypothetical protein n=1 Tax=Streptomyces sp. NPDC058268 TaxID=3346413 RepID=UPI0036E502DE